MTQTISIDLICYILFSPPKNWSHVLVPVLWAQPFRRHPHTLPLLDGSRPRRWPAVCIRKALLHPSGVLAAPSWRLWIHDRLLVQLRQDWVFSLHKIHCQTRKQISLDHTSLKFSFSLVVFRDPNKGNLAVPVSWPEFTSTGHQFIDINADMDGNSVGQRLRMRYVNFWTSVLPNLPTMYSEWWALAWNVIKINQWKNTSNSPVVFCCCCLHSLV